MHNIHKPVKNLRRRFLRKQLTSGSATSLERHSDGNHAQGDLPASPSRVTPTKKKEKDKKQKWGREDYMYDVYFLYVSRKTGWKPHRKRF